MPPPLLSMAGLPLNTQTNHKAKQPQGIRDIPTRNRNRYNFPQHLGKPKKQGDGVRINRNPKQTTPAESAGESYKPMPATKTPT